MKKSIFALACLPLCLIACKPKTEKSPETNQNNQEQSVSTEALEPVVDDTPSFVDNTPLDEVSSPENDQVLLKAIVKDNSVPLCDNPNGTEFTESAKKGDLLYVIGFDKDSEETANGISRWVQVKTENEIWATWYWVPSKSLDMNQGIKTSEISFNSCGEKQDVCDLKININRADGETIIADVLAQNCGDFYSFTWNATDSRFNYADPVGTFVWYPKTNTIEHFSIHGGDMESGWSKPTPDKKYLIVDYGTSAGMRAFTVYSMKNNSVIFHGGYYNDIEYDSDKIIALRACSYDDEGAEEFLLTGKIPESLKDYDSANISVVEKYSHHLLTEEEKSLGYEYVFVE